MPIRAPTFRSRARCRRRRIRLRRRATPGRSRSTPEGARVPDASTWDDDLVLIRPVKIVLNAAAGAISGANDENVQTDCVRTRRRRRDSPSAALLRSRALASDAYECVFEILTPDPRKRLVSEGVPAAAGAPIVIRHCQTNQCLAVPRRDGGQRLGDEFEVAGHTASSAASRSSCRASPPGSPAA